MFPSWYFLFKSSIIIERSFASSSGTDTEASVLPRVCLRLSHNLATFALIQVSLEVFNLFIDIGDSSSSCNA